MLSLTTRVKAIAKRCRLRQFAHDEDCRTQMSDAEIITTAMCAAMFFGGNHAKACNYMKEHKLIPNMLEKSRFNRRLHGISMLKSKLRLRYAQPLTRRARSPEIVNLYLITRNLG
jgi:hypothetical protein